MYKAPLDRFLSQNPFPRPLTQGFFYREKMRAIQRVAPDRRFQRILEVGGGKSGLTALLYPQARVVNLDCNHEYCQAPCNQQYRVRFVCGDAADLPFRAHSFDVVTMFDVLEHIPRHEKAISEALRILRPGGFFLISTPNEYWQFPYYRFMRFICPNDAEVMAQWGHIRRGYTLDELRNLIGLPCEGYATCINPFTVISHDVAFSNLSFLTREFFCTLLSPLTWLSYTLQKSQAVGTETVSAWQKGGSPDKRSREGRSRNYRE